MMLCRAHPVLLLVVILSGCPSGGNPDGGSDAGNTPGDDEGVLEASITGSPNGHTTLSVTTVPEAFAKFRETATGERLSVHANADEGLTDVFGQGSQSLRIYFPYDGVRTYTLGSEGGAAYAEDDQTHVFYAQYDKPEHGSGTITITSRTDDRLVGSFALIGENDAKTASVEINGTFDLPLIADGS